MSDFNAVLKECIENKDNPKQFKKCFNKLCETQEILQMIRSLKDRPGLKVFNYRFNIPIEDIENSIRWVLFERIKFWNHEKFKLKNHYLEILRAAKDLFNKKDYGGLDKSERNLFREYKTNSNKTEDIINLKIESLDELQENSDKSLIDKLKSSIYTEKEAESKSFIDKVKLIKDELTRIGKNDQWSTYVVLAACLYDQEYNYKDLSDLMIKLCECSNNDDFNDAFNRYSENEKIENSDKRYNKIKIKYKNISRVKKLLHRCRNYSQIIREILNKRYNFSMYSNIINYIIETNAKGKLQAKKLQIPELIIDFNKVRNYLSVILQDNAINNKSSFIGKNNKIESSYEKDIHRILSLFNKKGKRIFEEREEIKKFSPVKFSKIYDIHTVPNLIINILILDILKQYEKPMNLTVLMSEIFRGSKYESYDESETLNFRKNVLRLRLKELEEYGFIIKDKNAKYIFKAKFLTEKQNDILKFVVPFFCGIYPFSSIGHFLANRLNIKELFEFDAFNVSNILDDCITFDLLTAINNDKSVKLSLKDKKHLNIKPNELIIDGKNSLLKVIDEKEQEYYINEIDKVNDKKPNNLIFSEIYSFYYKIIEEMVKEFKQNRNCDISNIIEKYGSADTFDILFRDEEIFDINELLPLLSKLNNVAIPLTRLELQWLKTIMQDDRFDLFVSEKDKALLTDLVSDTNIEPFDLSSFKIYNLKDNKYQSISDFGIPEGLNKDEFRTKINKLNSA